MASSLSVGEGTSISRQAKAIGSIWGSVIEARDCIQKDERGAGLAGAPRIIRVSLFLLNREDEVLERFVRAAGGDERSVRDRRDSECVSVRDVDVGQDDEAARLHTAVVDRDRSAR